MINRGVDRPPFVRGDRDHVDFATALAGALEWNDVEIHAYCLMTNHFHLLVRASVVPLAAMMQHFGTTYTRHVNDRRERDGPLFSGRFHSVPIADGEFCELLRRVEAVLQLESDPK